jgi:hypothetical protein
MYRSFIALAVLWLSAVVLFTAVEYSKGDNGVLVRRVAPSGTAWEGHRMGISGSGAFTITEEERICRNERFAVLDRGGERLLFPLPSPWKCIKAMPVLMELRWIRFVAFTLPGVALILLYLRARALAPRRGAENEL